VTVVLQRTRWLLVAAWFLFWVFAVGVVVVKTRESAVRRIPPKMPVRWVRKPSAPALPTVKVERVAPDSIEGKLTLKGTLEPAAVETAVPQVNGRVAKVLTQPGKTVMSGDVVVKLDRSSLQADVKFTRSLLVKAQAQQQIVEKQRAAALNDLEKATEQLQAAQQDIAAAQENIAAAEAAVRKLRERPPAPPPVVVSPPQPEPQSDGELVAAQTAVRNAEMQVTAARAAVEQSEPAQIRAANDWATADKEFQRADKLYKAGAVSRRFFESKQEALTESQKKWEQANEELQQRRARLSQAETALAAAQNRLHQAKAQKPAMPAAETKSNTQEIAEVQALVKQAQERAAASAARAKELRAAHETAQQRADELEQQWQRTMRQVTDASELFTNKAALVGAADVHAPCDGMVTQVAVKVGDAITAGTPLVFVSALGAMRIRLTLPPEAIAFVKPKMTVPVVVPLTDGQEKELVGTVEQIVLSEPSVAGISIAEILIPTQDAPVKWGELVTCALSLGQKDNVLTVPVEAVHQDGQSATVFVMESSGVVRVREVALGWTDGSRYEVVEGLTRGEQVIVESSSTLREGDVVRVED
jgi:RND family efflux transporter MFP subunit